MLNKAGNGLNDSLMAMAVSVGICLMLYIALISSLAITLVILAIGLGLIIYGERTGGIEKIYGVMERHKGKALGIMVLFALVLPFLLSGNNYLLHVIVIGGIYSIIALGLNFQVGSTGMVNFAPAAFYGTGAYTSAVLAVKFGISPWLGMICGLFMAALLGVVFGFPALKTRGYYLSLVTIALQVIFTLMIINTSWLGGPNGIPGIPAYQLFGYSFRKPLEILGFQLPYQTNYFYLIFLLLGLVALAASRLYNSRIGLAWNAIEQDEIVAATQGINLTKIKLLAFSLGAAFAGVAGALYAHYTSFIGNEDFDFSKSLVLICMVLLGGMDNVVGVTLGAILLTIIDEKLRDFADYRMLMYALILIIILITRPQGLLPKRNRKYQIKQESDAGYNVTVTMGGK
ncbi:ABC transporter, permease [Moorella glycerini]|uniref:Leucine/isoleucine/valine transporter permease subunit n=1 Tax=Neomoorella stamsii TaxID=1266720 RepID=A0A9X7J353_9FIRM|nr:MULTISPECIES: branched-chain amino acid ABC transporter permease [Moorella]PRR73443.1 leucine/isoleucine/valine transporter permease subunit [Moorella stamsii]CEP69212.1 ABC transporter, permease [Moorella glycerini]